MSADSPRRSGSRATRQGGGSVCGNGGQVIVPQPVTDPSIIDSVTGFINDVVPQAYTSTLPGDFKETITWARFESADINDPALFPDNTSDAVLPIILILGYNTGVQVWTIPANGEASEVLSWSQGSVRTLRILPSPTLNSVHSSDSFGMKRPLVAICDSAGPGPPFCSVSFISLKTGDQVKSIKFKNPVSDVYANRRSVIVTFPERIAVFDACTLEDRMSITSCYPSPGPNANPVALGSRWLAFAEKKLVAWQRSSGGVGGAGAQSYTATVLHAAQTLGRGLRGLSETVASSLTGPRNHPGGQMGVLGSSPPTMNGTDHSSPGIVTVLDLEASTNRYSSAEEGYSGNTSSAEGVIAHFIAHNEAIVALEFDPSGTLLLTADRRGHDFHVFRLQPHPGGSSLAAVHHLYVLHRGDTTAKVQNVAFSYDSRWVAVSTMRGTTHVFPLTPYGGPVGFRTHGSPLVVNRLSRFHRSAGLSADGRSSPVPSPESPPCLPAGPHANPRLPPYPHPAVQAPLSQLRQSPHPHLAPAGALDVSLRVCATFASPRAWLLDSQTAHPRDGPRDSSKVLRRAVDSLFVMACHGNLVQYDLDPKPVIIGPREKICDDTQIELDVEAKAQWPLQRSPHSPEVLPPLPSSNPLLYGPELRAPSCDSDSNGQLEERWLSQVEIVTHAGPHRRLWMGPQITFKTYTTSSSGSNVSLQDVEAVEVGTVPVSRPARSNPVNMPSGGRPVVPVLIESGSGSSFEQSPHLLEVYGADSGDADHWGGHGDSRLREDLADAMLESPGAPSREKGKRRYYGLVGGGGGGGDVMGEGRVVRGGGTGPVRRVVNPGGAQITMLSDGDGEVSDIEPQDLLEHHWEAIAIPATAPVIPVPPASDSDSSPREMVTTIAAARLQRLPVQLVKELPTNPVGKGTAVEKHFQGLELSSISGSLVVGATAQSVMKNVDKKNPSVVGGIAEKESRIEKSSRNVGASCNRDSLGNTAEKAVQYCREGSIEKDDSRCAEVVKPVKATGEVKIDSREPVRKRNKKSIPLKQVEICEKSVDGVMEIQEGQEESIISAGFTSDDKGADVFSGTESIQPISGDKGTKAGGVIQENSADDVSKVPLKGFNSKAHSPPKDLSENKNVRKSSLTNEKDNIEDSSSVPLKKNKRKPSGLAKENLKKDEICAGSSPPANDPVVALKGDQSQSNCEGSGSESVQNLRKNGFSYKNESINVVSKSKIDLRNNSQSSELPVGEVKNVFDIEHDSKVGNRESCHEDKVGGEFKDSTANEEPQSLNVTKSKRKSLKSVKSVEEAPPECDFVMGSQNSTKSSQKNVKSLRKAEDEEGSPVETAANNLTTAKDDSQVVAKAAKTSCKVEQEEKLIAAELQVNLPEKERNSASKSKKNKIKDLNVAANSELGAVKSFQESLVDAVIDDLTVYSKKKNSDKSLPQDTAEGGYNKSCALVLEQSANDPPEPVPVKIGKKAKAKTCSSYVDSISAKLKTESESASASVWNIQSGIEERKVSDNFPALSSKISKKIWGITSDETGMDEKKNLSAEIAKKSEKNDSESNDVVGLEVPKAKRGWETPVIAKCEKSNTADMDIDQLTFEDLEAIVDAACKEEETKTDQTCLKENKKGKKNDVNNLLHSPKTKGKENIKEEVNDSNGGGSDLGEIIEVPKAAEEVIKLEEPVKSLEKPVSTPNKSSKAQRRKRR